MIKLKFILFLLSIIFSCSNSVSNLTILIDENETTYNFTGTDIEYETLKEIINEIDEKWKGDAVVKIVYDDFKFSFIVNHGFKNNNKEWKSDN